MNVASLKTFGWLLWRDVRVLKQDFFNNVIDSLMVPATFIIIGGYIMPYMGVPADYGAFMIVSSLVMMCYSTTAWRGATELVADLVGDKAISYELTLPLPSWLVFIKLACAYAVKAMALNILTLPLGKLLLWDKFSLANFSILKFSFVYVLSSLFFGFFSLWVTSWTRGMQGFGRFWLRYGSQLLFFSGFQFPWSVMYKATVFFAYLNLANPFLYAFEGSRAAVMGQAGSLNYWLCIGMLVLFTFLFAFITIRQFKRRLDYV